MDAPVPTENKPPPLRLTAEQALKHYGIRAVIFAVLTIWFAYDGWYNPNIESKTFNKIGAVLLLGAFVFHAVMAGSAFLAVRRQRQPGPPP